MSNLFDIIRQIEENRKRLHDEMSPHQIQEDATTRPSSRSRTHFVSIIILFAIVIFLAPAGYLLTNKLASKMKRETVVPRGTVQIAPVLPASSVSTESGNWTTVSCGSRELVAGGKQGSLSANGSRQRSSAYASFVLSPFRVKDDRKRVETTRNAFPTVDENFHDGRKVPSSDTRSKIARQFHPPPLRKMDSASLGKTEKKAQGDGKAVKIEIVHDPFSSNRWLRMLQSAESYRRSGELSSALPLYKKLWSETHSPLVANNYGAALILLGRYKEAQKVLCDALKLAPGDKDLLSNLSMAKYKEAENEAKEQKGLHPDRNGDNSGDYRLIGGHGGRDAEISGPTGKKYGNQEHPGDS